jgi:hypothetical protein
MMDHYFLTNQADFFHGGIIRTPDVGAIRESPLQGNLKGI